MQTKKKSAVRLRSGHMDSEAWSWGHSLDEWAMYLGMTCIEVVQKLQRWEGRGWCEVAWADNGRIFLRVTQRGVAISGRIVGEAAPRVLH